MAMMSTLVTHRLVGRDVRNWYKPLLHLDQANFVKLIYSPLKNIHPLKIFIPEKYSSLKTCQLTRLHSGYSNFLQFFVSLRKNQHKKGSNYTFFRRDLNLPGGVQDVASSLNVASPPSPSTSSRIRETI